MSGWRCELERTAFGLHQLPTPSIPEVAVVGRSNVGKSTLLNVLFNRTSKKLAHVSSTPGKTRSLNFYRVMAQDGADKRIEFFIVDLPGYGFASRGRRERDAWRSLIEGYFGDGDRVTFVMHLIDFRHGPLAADEELGRWLDRAGLPRLAVFTKCDKVPRGRHKSTYEGYIRDGLDSIAPPPMMCGKNDSEAERLRESIERAVSDLQDWGH